MNRKAAEMGLKNTNFTNPHGLTEESHYTTAYDLYLIFNEAIKYETFNQIIHTSEYQTTFYDKNGKFIMRQTELFAMPKHFEWKKPDIKAEILVIENKTVIDISSDTFAKGVFIDFSDSDCILSDNFFDIEKSEKRIKIISGEAKNLKVRSVYDIK